MRRFGTVVVVLAVLVFACGGQSTFPTAGTEIAFEPAHSTGPDPFTASVATTEITSDQAKAVRSQAKPGVVLAGNGTGLYGGSGDKATCDAGKLISFLDQNADKAKAWAGAIGIEPAEIRQYVEGLISVVLLRNTRVTNHGFRDGKATPRQSTLEAGTAVLIDVTGVPRVRCACGNPLLEPEANGDGAIAIMPGPIQAPPIVDVDSADHTTRTAPVPVPVPADDFCTIYADMRADIGGGPATPAELDAYVASLAEWLAKLIDAAQTITGFPADALADLQAYYEDAAAGPDAMGDTALRDRVEDFLEGYCENPPTTPSTIPTTSTTVPPQDEGTPGGPLPDSNCGSFQFFLLVEIAEGLGLDWQPVGQAYFDQLTEFEADSLDDMLTYEEIGCEGALAMIAFLEANAVPNPFA